MTDANAGVTLDSYLKKRGPIHYSKVARIACDLLAEIDRRARAGELKALLRIHPGRIRISGAGSVALLDAGELEAPPDAAALAAYAAPEEIQGRAVDQRTVLYSLGCALFELLAGKPPYPGDTVEEIHRNHLLAPVPDPRERNSGVPASLAGIVRGLLVKAPELRPAGPGEVTAEIRAALGLGTPAAAAPPAAAAAAASAAPPAAPPRPAVPIARRPAGKAAAGIGAAPRPARREMGRARGRFHGRRMARGAAVDPGEAETEGGIPLQARPSRTFTYTGIAVGGLIAVLLFLKALQSKSREPELNRLARESYYNALNQKIIAERRQERTPQFEREEQEAAAQYTRILGLPYEPRLKIDALVKALETYYHTPSGRRMAEEIGRLRRLGKPGP